MITEVKRNIIVDFIFGTLSNEQMPLIADIIIKDEKLNNAYIEEKKKLKTHLYVENELLPYEREEVESRMKTDRQLVKDINLQERINDSIDCINLKNTLEEICNQNEVTPQTQETIKMIPYKRKYKNWVAAASITILILLGAGIAYQLSNRDSLENRLYAKYYDPFSEYAGHYILNSSSYNVAKQKYLDGEFKNALLLLKKQPESVIIKVERDFFIGLSLLEVHQYYTALKYFEQAISSQQEFENFPQIRWYLGLSYLKSGNTEKAIETFDIIVNNKDYNYKKAKRILKKLRK